MRIISTRAETSDCDADEAEHAFSASRDFQLASVRAFETHLVDNRFQSARVPAVVCAAFSVELGIKARIIADGNKAKYKSLRGAAGHNLASLFPLLSAADQNWFIVGSNIPADEFLQNLRSVSEAFFDWRYVYEKSERVIDYSFLQKLSLLASTLPVAQ